MSRSRRGAVVGIIAAAAFTAQAGAAGADDRSGSTEAMSAQGRVLLLYETIEKVRRLGRPFSPT
jgi:hypothetical protein